MLTVGPNTRVFVALEPVDMRGSFDALAGHVRRLHADPLDGHIYLFLNRTRRLLKALWFDRTGWAIFSKRLERGTFELPPATEARSSRKGADIGVSRARLAGSTRR